MNLKKNNFASTGQLCFYASSVLLLFLAGTVTGQPGNYEGFGTVTGGADDAPGGYETYHVTSLANSGTGTFRDAVSQGSRRVVFDVGGTVNLSGSLYIRDISYLTIDGSTAPSPGITLDIPSNRNFYILGEAHDIIINNIRADGNYIGPHPDTGGRDVFALDGYYGSGPIYNVIIDHCTFTSASDGIQDTRGTIRNITYSWNLFKDTGFMGSFSDGGERKGISLHHNVYARGGERMPKIKNEDGSTTTDFDMVNNIVYGWNTYGGGDRGLQIEPYGWLLELHVTNNWYEPVNGDDDKAITIKGSGHRVDYEGNVFPSGERDDVDTATLPPAIPAWAQVTTYAANTLGDTVVPFVGTHYPTSGEQRLLNEIRSVIGGGQAHALSVSSGSGGSVTNPGEGSFPYNDGAVASVQATADNNYNFVNWTGTAVDAGKVANPSAAGTTVTVDGSYTIRANFATYLRILTISSTSGGSVTNPGEGSLQYGDQVVVSIAATAASNYSFVNWTGTAVDAGQVANPNSASTTVTVNGDYTLRANFSIDQNNLTTSSTLGGSVATPGEGIYAYDHSASASVVASPAAGYHFVSWTGTAVNAGKVGNANSASTTVTMDAAYSIQANFAIDQHILTVSSTSGGSVSSPGEGPFLYDGRTDVSIQATADNNYYFVNWTGTAVNAGKVTNPNSAGTTVTVDAGYSVQANFGRQDEDAPTISNLSPASGSIQAPLDSLIILHIADAGIGVDAGSVEIMFDGATIYSGDTSSYDSATGTCRRVGTPADYTYAYQSDEAFDFDQFKTVTVSAADIGGVVMNQQSYSFTTEMRSFGQNKQVSSGLDNLSNAGAATVRDSSGNIWAVWHAGPAGSRDIYVGKLIAGADAFGASVRLTINSFDQLNPAVALGANDKLYVVWQDNRRGVWDIYGSTSVNGTTWSAEQRIDDSEDNQSHNQVNPVVVVDSNSPNNNAYVAWQDDRAGNQDIFVAKSSDSFVTNSIAPVTSNTANQTGPAIAVTSSGVVHILWTDARNASTGSDIYGASGSVWTNVAVVRKAGNQSHPVIAAESSGSVVHMLWVDQVSGNSDIYYGSSSGLPSSPLSGSNLIEDSLNAEQVSPTIAVAGTGGSLKVFGCWQDGRNVSGNTGDLDLYMVQANSGSGTNVFVGDGGTNSDQTEPAMAIDQDGYPYIVWTDNYGTNTGIYYVGSTFTESVALVSGLIDASSGGTIGAVNAQSITDVDDVSISLPAGASPYDMTISITKVDNPREFVLPILNGYEFSPSGVEFSTPVTITIPFAVTGAAGTPTAYWYNSLTGALSQEGISNIEIIELTPSLHALRFTTTHFTPYYALLGAADDAGSGVSVSDGGGGGGGCSLDHSRGGSILEYFLPYAALAMFIVALKRRDRRSKRLCKRHLL